MKYLNDTGLTYFWEKLKTKFNSKQDTLTIGHNINIDNNNVISTKVKCFEWDGQSSTANPNNIALWQEIVNSTADGSNVLVVGKSSTNNDNTYRFVIVLNSLSFSSGNSKTIAGLVSHFWSANHAQDTQLSINRPKVTITFTNSTDKIISSVGNLTIDSSSIQYLPLTSTSVTNYTPTYDYHPATKKYVDDSKTTVTDNLTSTSTTEALSANQGKVLNDTKVDKVTGKGLSTNDFTTTEQTKLAGIEIGAEVNMIEQIKVNGTVVTPDANKAVDLSVAVIESGSNSNGNYVKYSDGTMICNKKVVFNNIVINTTQGSLYSSNNLSLGNFAQEFIEIPCINISLGSNDGYTGMLYAHLNVSTTSAGTIRICRGVTTTSGQYIANVQAIGKWQ